MGEITDALRAGLRELAQSDARLLREFDAAIPSGSAGAETPSPSAAVARIDDGLERLSLKDLKDLCKQRRIKGIAKLKKDELIALLRAGVSTTPAVLPAAGRAAAAALPPADSAPALPWSELEARLERMEGLLQRIARQLEVT